MLVNHAATGGKSIVGSAVVLQYERRRITSVIMQSKTFEGITMEDAEMLVNVCDIRTFAPGDLLIRQVSQVGFGGSCCCCV